MSAKTTKKMIGIGICPLAGDIYAGTLLKDGTTLSTRTRNDITELALKAVAMHVIFKGGALILHDRQNTPICRIAVEEVS